MDAPEIEKLIRSESDRRQYRLIELDNGLRAMLVRGSDPTSVGKKGDTEEDVDGDIEDEEEFTEKMAAACLTVRCGSLQDPRDIPGVAHYLEHVLFLGSEKYPKENEYTKFTSEQGGGCNACTNRDLTSFDFGIPQKGLQHALDILASAFVAPLLREDALDREVQAVDSEFQLNRASDSKRVSEVLARQAGDHPIGKFGSGNLRSLKERPAESGINMRQALVDFFNNHYSADIMTLAVQSQHSLDELESFVRDSFTAIPRRDRIPIEYPVGLPFHDNPEFFKLYKILPVEKDISLALTWVLPSQRPHFRDKSASYICYAISHGGRGGLFDHLQERQWVLDLSAYESSDQDFCSFFTIYLPLTDEGARNIAEVARFVHQYMHMLRKKGPQKWMWDECKQLSDIDFRFEDEDNAYSFVNDVSENMQLYPEEHYICGDALYLDYNPERIQMLLNLITPDKCNAIYMNPELQTETDSFSRTEPWTEASYEIEEYPEDWSQLWVDDEEFQQMLKLPDKNIFIATDFDIKDNDGPSSATSRYPVLLEKSDTQQLWFRKDTKFNKPETTVRILFATDSVFSCPRSTACINILPSVFAMTMTEIDRYSEMASLRYFITAGEMGMVLYFDGYSDKLQLLINIVLDRLSSFDCSEELFNNAKISHKRHCYNMLLENCGLVDDAYSYLIQPRNHTIALVCDALDNLTKDELFQWKNDIFRDAFVEGYVHGNAIQSEAKEILALCASRLSSNSSKQPVPLAHAKFEGQTYFRLLGINVKDTCSLIRNYYYNRPGHFYEQTMMELLVTLVSEPCFQQLRCEEQLGYDIGCYTSCTYKVVGFSIQVSPSAEKFTLSEVDEEIERFVDRMITIVDELSLDRFDTVRCGLVKQKSCADLTLHDEAGRNWLEIESRSYTFDCLQLEVKFLKELDLDRFRNWALKVIHRERSHRSKVSMQTVGHGRKAIEECEGGAGIWQQRQSADTIEYDGLTVPPFQLLRPIQPDGDKNYISDFEAYRASLEFYPAIDRLDPNAPLNF